jgi:hypothetical protein
MRVIRLEPTIISAAYERGSHRMACPRSHAARTLVEISRILVKQGWKHRAADDSAGESISVRRGVTFSVSFERDSSSGSAPSPSAVAR